MDPVRKCGVDLLPVRLRPFTEPDLELFERFATDPALSEPFGWVGCSANAALDWPPISSA